MFDFLAYIIPTTLRMGTPIAFTALGGVMSERSGVNNIGMEGIMVAGAFMAVVGSYFTGSPIMGILLAMLVGILISAIHSLLTITFGAKQAVSSMALVLLADGLAGVGVQAFFKTKGTTPTVMNLPGSPLFAHIPVIGNFMAGLSPFVYIGFGVLIGEIFLFKYTKFGFHISVVGENPTMAESAGLNVHAIRWISVLSSGMLGGLGGAMLSIGQMNLYQDGMIAGRGYLALGAVSMGRWNPLYVYGSSMLFGLFDALQLWLQTIPSNPIPAEFIQMLPYVAIVCILAISSRNIKYFGITSAGVPFTKYVSER
ncbi:MAG: ABC transporter permease [Sphaerochaetaceae bacterium]|nr:ABC transporter permease [Spirochaetales bacterium]MDY5500581.1 ABC transporter permease [Sphaerochaetaceae bacterium]